MMRKKIKYTFPYIKKNLDLKELLGYLEQEPDHQTNILDFIIWASSIKSDSADFYKYADKVLTDFDSSIKKNSYLKLLKYQFEGTLLPKINKNFNLELYFEMSEISHALISSKLNKKFYHIYSFRDSLSFKKASTYLLPFCCIIGSLKKKPNKKKFFELIMKDSETREDQFMEQDKSIDYEERERLWEETGYVSEKGINYLTLYKKGKL